MFNIKYVIYFLTFSIINISYSQIPDKKEISQNKYKQLRFCLYIWGYHH
jgi:hypothetical protein